MSSLSMRLPAALRQLPPLPRALTTAMEVIQDDRSTRADLVRILELDQSLTGLFLRMVNSAYYSLPRRVTSLDEAIGYLGFETVKSVIFAIATSKIMSGPVPAYQLERGLLWHHAVAVATGAQWIAMRRSLKPISDAYVAGLLHDIGKLVMDLILDHKSDWARSSLDEMEKRSWTYVEQQVTGYDHAEIGAVVTRSWNLPDNVVEAVGAHHEPGEAKIDPNLTAAVHIADAAALMAGIGLGIDGLYSSLDVTAVDRLRWTEDDMEGLLGAIQEGVAKARDVLQVRG